MTKLSRWPFHPRPSQVLSCLSRRFVLSRTRPHCTETQSPTYLTLTREPSASSEKRTENTWLLMDSQTLQEGWRDLTPQQQRVPARKWSSSRVLWEHKDVLKRIQEIGLCFFFLKMYYFKYRVTGLNDMRKNASSRCPQPWGLYRMLGTRHLDVLWFISSTCWSN